MPGKLTKRQVKGITKMLDYDYLKEKELKKKRRQAKAQQKKADRHKSKAQEIEEIVEQELEWEGGEDENAE